VFSAEELSGVLASTSICFDLSVYEIFVPLCWGGKVIVSGNALELPDIAAREEVKLVNTVPSAMQELMRSRGVPRSVVTINLAGEALTASLVKQVY
jgi:non-ribosomal peptide synthetase component F